jgi:hypothetical protein
VVLLSHPEAPKEMAVAYNLGGEYVELEVVFNIEPKDNKIAANKVSPHHFRMP